MTDMINQVADALEPKCLGFGHGNIPRLIALEMARTAIAAMREPSREMCETGEDKIAALRDGVVLGVRCGCEDCDQRAWEAVANVWRSMIDQILKTQNDGK